jgi:hypothetical protein
LCAAFAAAQLSAEICREVHTFCRFISAERCTLSAEILYFCRKVRTLSAESAEICRNFIFLQKGVHLSAEKCTLSAESVHLSAISAEM